MAWVKGPLRTWQLPFPEHCSVLLESPPHTGETHLGVAVQLALSWKRSFWEEPIWELSTMTYQSLPEVTLDEGVAVPNCACTWNTAARIRRASQTSCASHRPVSKGWSCF